MYECARNAWRLSRIKSLTLWLWLPGLMVACGTQQILCGAGTTLRDGVCVVESDGGRSDSDSGVLAERDGGRSAQDAGALEEVTLVLPSRVVITPGLLTCVVAQQQKADGSLEIITGHNEVTTADATIALGAQNGDCSSGFGIIGVSAGNTSAQVAIRRGSRVGRGTVPVAVIAAEYTLTWAFSGVLVGGSLHFPGMGGSVRARATGAVSADLANCDCRIVPRWLSVISQNPGVLEVSTSNDKLLEHGVASGTASINVSYAPPGAAAKTDVAQVNVGTAPLSSIAVLALDSQGGSPVLVPLGDCLVTQAIASYGTFLTETVTGVSWSHSPELNLTNAGNPGQVCATAPGPTTLRACVSGVCGSNQLVITGGRALVSLDANVLEPNALPGGANIPEIHFCPRVRLTARFDDDTSIDVTTSPYVQWRATFEGALWQVSPAKNANGNTLQDPQGNPCLLVGPPNGRWASGTAQFTVSYLEGRASFGQTLTF